MRTKSAAFWLVCFLLVSGGLFSQEGKPNFSGNWKFSKEESDLKRPTFRQMDPGPWGGGPGMGGPGMGGPGGRRTSGNGGGVGNREMMGVAESLMLLQEEPKLAVKVSMKFDGN